MHATLLTLLMVVGADHSGSYHVQAHSAVGHGHGAHCDTCHTGHGGRGNASRWERRPLSKMGPMPQSCYEPTYGCYPSTRHVNRYPAFHGSYYRTPYNYRHVFEYPWHADPHEPTSLWSYNVAPEQPAFDAPPIPTSDPSAGPLLRPLPIQGAGYAFPPAESR